MNHKNWLSIPAPWGCQHWSTPGAAVSFSAAGGMPSSCAADSREASGGNTTSHGMCSRAGDGFIFGGNNRDKPQPGRLYYQSVGGHPARWGGEGSGWSTPSSNVHWIRMARSPTGTKTVSVFSECTRLRIIDPLRDPAILPPPCRATTKGHTTAAGGRGGGDPIPSRPPPTTTACQNVKLPKIGKKTCKKKFVVGYNGIVIWQNSQEDLHTPVEIRDPN